MRNRTKKLLLIGALLSLSLIFSYVEASLPPFLPHPAFKIGLIQIPVLLAFYLFDLKAAGFVSLSKVFLISLLLGFFLNLLFFVNLAGALVSILFLAAASKLRFSIFLASVFSSLGHNLGQFTVIAFSLGLKVAVFYLPFILVFSVVFGLLTGLVSRYTLERIPRRLL